MIDVFGLGQACVDRLAFVDSFPAADEKAEVTGLTIACGGPVGTALWALARWGRTCAFSGVVGDDEAGERIRADLEAAGVDASRTLVRENSHSPGAFIAVEQGTGRRKIYWQRATGAPPGPGEIEPPGARIFLTDGLYAEASLGLARRAAQVVVDAGTLREGTEALLDVAQVFVASESFARAFAGNDDPAGACRKIAERGVKVAGVTLGERGYVARVDGRLIERPAHKVETVDTTGCGDIFHAGLVEGMIRGWGWDRCFDFAAWAAARCATALGGRAGVERAGEYPPGYA